MDLHFYFSKRTFYSFLFQVKMVRQKKGCFFITKNQRNNRFLSQNPTKYVDALCGENTLCRRADKSLVRPRRKQATATEDFDK